MLNTIMLYQKRPNMRDLAESLMKHNYNLIEMRHCNYNTNIIIDITFN